jgi:squalene-hopene/tetraprenyl-beta-curcumene cyclase
VSRIDSAATAGIQWLVDLQNRDGGWPTFCRGWGKLPFDRSGVDLTAHAIRALHAWDRAWESTGQDLITRMLVAIKRGSAFLAQKQRADGDWMPLWFGNQEHPAEENPVYGTGRVLLAYRDLGRLAEEPAQRGLGWLATNQNADGGWGGAVPESLGEREGGVSSVEETAVAVEALASVGSGSQFEPALGDGLRWLVEAVESGRHRQASPIGFYFARLWYYEKLYPLAFTVSALGRALCRACPDPGT